MLFLQAVTNTSVTDAFTPANDGTLDLWHIRWHANL